MVERGKFKVAFIFEMLGKPADYLKESLDKHVDKLKTINSIKIISRKIHEPKPVEGEEYLGLLTTFAEVEVEVDSLNWIFAIVLNMLPSSVEIIEPGEVTLKNFDMNTVLTDLSVKLHQYDEVTRAIIMERDNLMKKINDLEHGYLPLKDPVRPAIEPKKEEIKKVEEKKDNIPKSSKKKKTKKN